MTGFAARLRRATMTEHREAETRSFISRLMAGRVPPVGFAALTAQYLVIYRELEAATEAMRSDPVAGPFADPALSRVAALEADLAHLHGSSWERLVVPATRRYADRLRTLGRTSAPHFIAHHYVRYLGDLSGGLMVGRSVADTYGLTDAGVAFYSFDGIADPKAYKKAYRSRLDELPYSEDQLAAMVAEAQLVFALNAAVFQDLGAAYPEEHAAAA